MAEGITTAITNLFTIVGTCLTEITSQPVLCILFVGGSLVPLGLKTVKRLKRASK